MLEDPADAQDAIAGLNGVARQPQTASPTPENPHVGEPGTRSPAAGESGAINDTLLPSTDNEISITAKKEEERQSASASLKEKGHPVTSDEAFDAFWQAYPRKVAKATAKAAYARKATTPEAVERILQAVNNRVGLSATDPRFIPHPASWLRAERWMDEEPRSAPSPNGARPSLRASRAPMSSADAQRMIDAGDLGGFELA